MQGDFITRNDDRLYSGYGSCLLVREFGDKYFNLVVPSESVPAISGDYETFTYNSLLSDVISKVRGKRELDEATMEFSYSRENILRLDELTNRTMEFMRFNPNFTFETYTAQLSYKQIDSEGDVLKGEITIVPYSLGVKGIDGRDLIRQSLEFGVTLPDEVILNSENKTKTLDLSIKQMDANATYDIVVEGSSKITGTVTGNKLTISAASDLEKTAYATLIITAKSETKMDTEGSSEVLKYAPWTMTIAVAYNA